MNYKIINTLLFTAGAVIGSAVTWKFVKTKYERLAQEEIESVKEAFSRNRDSSSDTKDDEQDDESETDDTEGQNEYNDVDENGVPIEGDGEDPQDYMMRLYEYEANVRRLGYLSAANREQGGGEPVYLAPYVISPDEFAEDGYDSAMLTYYSDGVLEDEYWNVIDDVEDIIGKEFEDRFGEYANDTVFIRNEKLHTDYEVTYDRRTHAESQMYSPHGVEDDA